MLESNFLYPYIPLDIVLARADGCRSLMVNDVSSHSLSELIARRLSSVVKFSALLLARKCGCAEASKLQGSNGDVKTKSFYPRSRCVVLRMLCEHLSAVMAE